MGRQLTQKHVTVHCGKCNHQWNHPMPLPLPMARAITVMRGIVAAGCPACGATGSDVLVGGAPKADVSTRRYSRAHP